MNPRAAVAEFLLDRKSCGCKTNTITFYRSNLYQILYFLERRGIEQVSEISRADVRAWFAEQSERVESGEIRRSTVAAYDRVLRFFCRFCMVEGWLDKDPMDGRPRLRAPRSLPDTWTLDEVQRLLETCEDMPIGWRDRAILLLWLDTGLRAGEMANLTPDCVELDGDRGLVVVRGENEGSKSDRDRVVPFWSETAEAMRKWLSVRPAEADVVFVAFDGYRQATVDGITGMGLHQIMRRKVRQSGVPRKRSLCHIWRHTFAKNYVLAGGDLETLRQMLGHSSLDTVRIYLGFKTEDLKARHFELSPVRQLFEKQKASHV